MAAPATAVAETPTSSVAGPRMRAIIQTEYGAADVLRPAEIERPAIGADEVLVGVRAAGLDRGTWHLMTGKPYLPRASPSGSARPKNPVPGLDVAGVVVAVGSAVTRFRPATRCSASARAPSPSTPPRARTSSRASPANLTFEQAAAVPVSGMTALQGSRDVGRVAGRAEGADHRRVGRRRQLRRAAGQGARRRGHRRVQHRQARPGPIARRRPRHRLHPGRLRRRRDSATT